MKVTILAAADDDLARIAEWIAKDNRSAAARIVAKIRDQISFLEMDELAHMGRPGLVETSNGCAFLPVQTWRALSQALK